MLRPPYPSARDHFYITNVDDRDYLEDIIRAFFEQYLGKGFRFKVEFQSWLRENAGLTFRDAVEAYPMQTGRWRWQHRMAGGYPHSLRPR